MSQMVNPRNVRRITDKQPYGSRERKRLPIGPFRALLQRFVEEHNNDALVDVFLLTKLYRNRESAARAVYRCLHENSDAGIDLVDAVCLQIDGPDLLEEMYPLAEFYSEDTHLRHRGPRERTYRVGDCAGCGRRIELRARGKCATCYRRELAAERARNDFDEEMAA